MENLTTSLLFLEQREMIFISDENEFEALTLFNPFPSS